MGNRPRPVPSSSTLEPIVPQLAAPVFSALKRRSATYLSRHTSTQRYTPIAFQSLYTLILCVRYSRCGEDEHDSGS